MCTKIEITRDEVKLLSDKVNHLDNLRFRARQMAALLTLGIVSIGASREIYWLFIVAAITPLPFWITEAYYRSYQQICICRLKEIEAFLQIVLQKQPSKGKESFDIIIPDAFGVSSNQKKIGFHLSFFRTTMILFYVSLMTIGIVGIVWKVLS